MNYDLKYEDWILWFAGWFDGEGSIMAIDSNRKYGGVYLSLTATSTDLDVLEYVQHYIGGNIYGPITGTSEVTGVEFKDRFNWRISQTQKCIDIATQILPFLCARRKAQVEDALNRQRWGYKPTQKDLFLKKVIKNNDCLLWTGHKDKHGFGTCNISGSKGLKKKQAHKVAFDLFEEYSPPRLINVCGNKSCVYTKHWVVDSKENRQLIHATALDES